MKWFVTILYTSLVLGANVAIADYTTIAELRRNDMEKLQFHSTPKAASKSAFSRADGSVGTLEEFRGKIVLLNFWATWCAPCRKEMPELAALERALGGDRFGVVTIATGHNKKKKIAGFFEEVGIENLPQFMDQNNRIAADMGVFGLPISVFLNPEGDEIARLRGDAKWNDEAARKIVEALIEEYRR